MEAQNLFSINQIKYFTASRAGLYGHIIGMPDNVREKLTGALGVIDSVFPGTSDALKHTGINFMYDPAGRFFNWTGDSEPGITRSGYARLLNTIYFSKSGLRRSIPHEIVHAIDCGAGNISAPFSVLAFCDESGHPMADKKSSPEAVALAYFFVSYVTARPIDREYMLDDLKQLPGFNFGNPPAYLLKAFGNNLDVLNDTRRKMNDHITETIAVFFERALYQRTRSIKAKIFLPDKSYRLRNIRSWTDDFIEESATLIDSIWSQMLKKIAFISDEEMARRRKESYSVYFQR